MGDLVRTAPHVAIDNRPQSTRRQHALVFGGLMVAAALASVAILPFLEVLTPEAVPEQPLVQLLANSIIQSLVAIAPLTLLGLWLGGKVGLGAPDLHALIWGTPSDVQRVRRSAVLAAVVGGVAGVLTIVGAVLFALAMSPDLAQTQAGAQQPSWWAGLPAAYSAGVNEELLLRLGVMTLLAWGGTRLAGAQVVTPAVGWTANIVAAVLFGALHLPLAAALAPLTVVVVVRTIVLNAFVGTIFGWLYWRHGLLAAMVAHFSVDIVLHVLPALLVAS